MIAGVAYYRQPPLSLPQPGFQGEKAEGHKGGAQGRRPRGAASVHGISPAQTGIDTAADKTLPLAQGPPPASACSARLCQPKGRLPLCHERREGELTGVDKPPWSAFTELLGLVGQGDLDDARNVPRWGLDSDGVGSYQLQKPHGEQAFRALLVRGDTLQLDVITKMSKIGPSSGSAPS